MVASVPELTMRSFSTAGTRRATSSASSTSASVGAPKEVPRAVAACTASTTRGWACPAISGPQEQTRSTYRFPSTSHRYGPCPPAKNRGVPPTAPNARTGEFTPPGMTSGGPLDTAPGCARPGSPAFLAQLGQQVEVLGGGRRQVGRDGQLGQVATVPRRRQDGRHRRRGQGQAEQRLVEGLVPVPFQEPEPGPVRPPPGRGARGSRTTRPAPVSAAMAASSRPGSGSATL